ncbi:MAG: glycerol-3-phosphate acyltransferase [Ruminococcus sp.]|nr:glycerol-3-phosphate acyltransferase [Ruminococcus sp.]
MQIALCTFIGYLIGNINPAYIIGRLKGFDIRQRGSGNAGASNVVITMGKKAGLFTALFDIFKAAAAAIIAYHLFPQLKFAKILSGSACLLGHIFPFMMKFHGGKGLACLGGLIIAFDPKVFLLMLMFELVLGLAADYVCIVPTTGSLIFTAVYALITGDPVGTLILAAVSLVIMHKHIENFRRIQHGTEAHISFLWHKDEEIERIRNNSN